MAAVLTAAGSNAALVARASNTERASVVDQTFSCAAQIQVGLPVISLAGSVRTTQMPTAGVSLSSGSRIVDGKRIPLELLAFSSAKGSLMTDATRCRRTLQKAPLNPSKLGSDGIFTPTFGGAYQVNCTVSRRLLVHLRLMLSGSTPTSAQLLVENQPRGSSVAFIRWSPTKLSFFSAARCEPVH